MMFNNIYLGAYGVVYKVQRLTDSKLFAMKKMVILGVNTDESKHFYSAYQAEVSILVITNQAQ